MINLQDNIWKKNKKKQILNKNKKKLNKKNKTQNK